MRGVYKLIRTRNKASTVFPSLSSLTQRDDYQRVPFCVLELTARCNSSGSKPLMTISVEWLTEPRLSLLTEMRRRRRRRPSESRALKRLTPTVCKFSSPSDRTGPVLRNASCFFLNVRTSGSALATVEVLYQTIDVVLLDIKTRLFITR